MGLPVPSARELVDGSTSAAELALRKSNAPSKSAREVSDEYSEFTQEMKKATIAGLNGETDWDRSRESAETVGYVGQTRVGSIRHDPSRHSVVTKAMDDYEMAKSTEGVGPAWDRMSKEWSLTTPISTGLLPFDLEAPVDLRAAA